MMKEYKFLDLGLANKHLEDELKQAACRVIESGWYLHGPETKSLEKELAEMCGTKHCIGVSNGLDALRLIFKAYIHMGKLHEGDKVIVQANTYIASVLSITDNGLIPVLCEPSESTLNIDSSKVEALIDDDVKAIMVVHLYGTPCWDEKLRAITEKHHLLVIEDNAQAIGAKAEAVGINGHNITCGLGHASAISFYPTKNLGALGDAGAVLTSDETLAAAVKALANYGSDRRYHNIYQGYNCRLDEIQAAMLRVKLRHLDEETERRNKIAATFSQHITNPLVVTPCIFPGMVQVWHQYVVRVQNRDAFRDYLLSNGIHTDVHYATPPHKQPCYAEMAYCQFPITEKMASEVVSLPIASPISIDDAIAIADVINKFQG
ncbi:MAG: DegT/DnrJ/EryC1/StrS family aminotransferase [Bacteroidales bacterium]|nr:DegT/DnrJ/EryC1/StrS family aminotransferase [Bacteroidales bacterium]